MGNGIQRIERRVKLQDLRVLMSVVERGSMAKAAESLATSQPAISRSIGDLEFSLGVRLLDRGPRGARRRLTAARSSGAALRYSMN
jgi:DNA-binding transcriptional LysR family regulator